MKLKAIALTLLVFVLTGLAQDSQELDAERAASARLKGEHPLIALIKSKPSSLRPELARHPP